MKRFLSVILLFALLLSCCGCTREPAATEPTTTPTVETTEPIETTEAPFASVNELEPNAEGIYQIHSVEGLKNMAAHPDGSFELLCDIDMGGTTWSPLDAFTGKLNGSGFCIFNFCIDTADGQGNIGFFGQLAGEVQDLTLRQVTMTTTAQTKQAGLWAGTVTDTGKLLRCATKDCAVQADALADGATIGAVAGINHGQLRNSEVQIDLTVGAAGAAEVGGIVGNGADGSIQYVKNKGALQITNGSTKHVGLFAGAVTPDTEILGAVFLGTESAIDGQVFLNFAGTGESEKISGCAYRDNTPRQAETSEIQAARDKVEAAMRAQGEIVWRVPENLAFSCHCDMPSCYGVLSANMEIHGVLYNHKCGSLARLQYCLGDDNVLDEWAYLGDYDGFDMYIGNDCSGAIKQAYMTVSGDLDYSTTTYMNPAQKVGTVPVGDWEWDLDPIPQYTTDYITATGEERMLQAYACLRKGDFTVNIVEAGGHARMAAEDAVIVRDSRGNIDANESYVLMHEQGAPRTLYPYYSSWLIDQKYTFAQLMEDSFVPATLEELVTGEFETPQATLENGVDGKPGLTTGMIQANFYLDSVTMTIQDSNGETVFDQTMFNTVDKITDSNSLNRTIRRNIRQFALARFATPLGECMFELGETYQCTVTAHLGSGDDIVVKEFAFTNGTAT